MGLQPLEALETALSRLPGFGRRSARRAAMALVREKSRLLDPLADALAKAKSDVVRCSVCGAFTSRGADPCAMCTDTTRDGGVVCVVEDPADVLSIESSGAFRGKYHTLGGKLSPARGAGPEKLRFEALAGRVRREGIREILLALSTDMDGDATAGYLAELLKDSGARITRLAFGLPADSGVAYSDPLTLKRAIANRIEQ